MENRAPNGANDLTFRRCAIERVHFLGAIVVVEEVFLGKFCDFGEGDLEFSDSDLNENTSLW